MNKPFDYVAEANLTLSNNFHGNKVSLGYLHSVLVNAIGALNALDAIKKSIFYGREMPGHIGEPHGTTCAGIPEAFDADYPARGEILFHSIIGKATESGELLELLASVVFGGVKFDEVNFIEEIGDGFWYDAIGLNAVKATFADVQQTNIAKLRHRFPNKFSEYDANNRDLFGERNILEAFGEPVDPLAVMAQERGKQFARLENWFKVGSCLFGDVRNHPKLGDEDDCTTSTLIAIDETEGFAETRNTVYRLGVHGSHKVSNAAIGEVTQA